MESKTSYWVFVDYSAHSKCYSVEDAEWMARYLRLVKNKRVTGIQQVSTISREVQSMPNNQFVTLRRSTFDEALKLLELVSDLHTCELSENLEECDACGAEDVVKQMKEQVNIEWEEHMAKKKKSRKLIGNSKATVNLQFNCITTEVSAKRHSYLIST